MYYFVAKEYTLKRIIRSGGKGSGTRARKIRQQGGERKQGEWNDALHECAIVHEQRLYGLLSHIPGSPIVRYNRIDIFNNTKHTYAAMFAEMEQARSFIHIESYIIRDDATGERFKKMMVAKVAQGVKVRLLCDGVGSFKLSSRYVQELQQAGVEVYRFLPPLLAFFTRRMNYRNHRKVIVIDGKVGFLGGINIGDEYLGADPQLGYWRDSHIRIEGASIPYLQQVFATDWAFASGKQLPASGDDPVYNCEEDKTVQLIAGGPDVSWDAVQEVFFAAMTAARNRIYMTTPYFIPDPSIRMALKTAAVSGVDVRIIVPGVPDTRLVHWASLSYVQELLEVGVRFYQYQKGFIHAKTLVVDQLLATVGTANMDMRSFFNNFEVMAVLYDQATIARLERDFMQDLKHSKEMSQADFEKRSSMQRLKEAAGRILAPLL